MATVIATTMINDTNRATQSIRLNIGSLSIPYKSVGETFDLGTGLNGLRPPVLHMQAQCFTGLFVFATEPVAGRATMVA
jgi:hypothetical protein